jgi:Fur family ferric uptake transcriptional regulator/Fur family peroxide stress response transcriptional regulator
MRMNTTAPSKTPIPRRHLEMLELFRELGPQTHLSAADVYEKLRARGHDIGLATIHRGLTRLSSVGSLTRVSLPNAEAAVYELANMPHSHFTCEKCAVITDVPYTLSIDEQASLEQQFGLTVHGSTLSFTGICQGCKHNNS